MEELLRQAFQLGQQWVQDMNNEKEPMTFNEWYASDKVQKQLQLGGVVGQGEQLKPEFPKDRITKHQEGG